MEEGRWQKLLNAMRRGPPEPDPRDERPVVLFRTPWKRPDDGWAVAARAYARAMHLGGLDVRLSSWQPNEPNPTPEVWQEVGAFTGMPPVWDVHVFSCMLGSAKNMSSIFSNMALRNTGPQAYHCVFERQNVEADLAEKLNLLAGVWAQCSANRDVLVEAGVRNVTLIHHPYFDDDPHLRLDPPRECRRYYWIGRNEPRKAPDVLVRAFMRAFHPGEARLTLKLSAYAHTHEVVPITSAIEDEVGNRGWTASNWRDSIHLIEGRLSKEEMLQLHADNDVYVSASRGEGLDLPAFAAKMAGRQLVLTDSGGPRDFLNDGDVLVPPCGLVPASADYSWGEGAVYFDHKIEDLAVAMQSVHGTKPAGSRLDAKFKAERVGQSFAQWIEQLTRQ